jgi:tripartite-type tricarboxylate transporter receptor subunit TctC
MTHVPYKGGADAQRDLVTDLVDIFITPYGLAQVELVKQGKVKAVAVLTPRAPAPAARRAQHHREQGAEELHREIGTGYFVKRDTPEPVVQTLHRRCRKHWETPSCAPACSPWARKSRRRRRWPRPTRPTRRKSRLPGIAKSIGLNPQ